MERLFLRLAVELALKPGADGSHPTLAGGLVYDSRIDPLAGDDDLAAIEGNPVVTIYTDKSDAHPYAAPEHRYPAREQFVDLVLELWIAAKGQVEVEMPDGSKELQGTLEAPVTDRKLEAILDVLEWQIGYRLKRNRGFVYTRPYHALVMETHLVSSVPQRADDRVTRLAARTVHYRVKLKSADDDVRDETGLPAPFGLVAAALQEGSSAAEVAAFARAALPDAPVLPTGLEIRTFAGLGRVALDDDADVVGGIS